MEESPHGTGPDSDPSAPDPIDIELAGMLDEHERPVATSTAEVMVWHDEADRLATWGHLDPVDGCMCRDCVLSAGEGDA